MQRRFVDLAVLTIIALHMAGCHAVGLIYLESPTRELVQELPSVSDSGTPSHFANGSVEEMLKRIVMRSPAGHAEKNVSPILRNGLYYLVREFGPPVYKGTVTLVITDDPSDNAHIMWRENDLHNRTITLNHYNIMQPVWYHYLVHELFHAFYQSNLFLKVHPDSIIEGLAIYAQYKYQNPKMSNEQLQEKIRQDAKSLFPASKKMSIDFDRPFGSYGARERKYAYLVSGLVFFSQDPKRIDVIIEELLRDPQQPAERLPFDNIIEKYNMTIDDAIIQRNKKAAITLPAPVKVYF